MRLDPKTFWTMTPLELAIATGMHRDAGTGAPGRGALEALMLRFPDRAFGHGNADDDGGPVKPAE
ncbi:phage tail assembly chaperone [Rhizobium sp. GN54]|nr:phage tail assembly chaperone [Rhizobium sp. GN54]